MGRKQGGAETLPPLPPGECPNTLSTMHVFALRGARGGSLRCACGYQVNRDDYLDRLERVRIHRLIRCACAGDVDRCDEHTARDALRWQRQRIGYFDHALGEAQQAVRDALRRLHEVERRLAEERRHADLLATDLAEYERSADAAS